MTRKLEAIAEILQAADLSRLHLVAGFDGFVDEMIEVVEERQSLHEHAAVPTIARFSELLAAAAGRSSLREIVVRSQDAGGCAVNLADGAASLGVAVDLFATLGTPVHKAFAEVVAHCATVRSWGSEPGRTLALEFQDGKYMLASMEQLAEIDEALLDQTLADGSYLAACRRAGCIAITNWTLYPHMTACWGKLQREVYARLEQRPWFFIDLVDPRSRSEADIHSMLQTLGCFEQHGPTCFGGNRNEGNTIAQLLGVDCCEGDDGAELLDQARTLRRAMGISQVTLHGIRLAATAGVAGEALASGPYTPSPKKSTGAGDRFNAGYCLGQLLDLDAEQRLLLGNATSGFFVRHARSASRDELVAFIRAWAAGTL
jgi:sugar/nucleoside kinase (ribokinase family)